MRLQQHIVADFALLLLTAIWGTSFPLVKTALQECGVFTFVAMRFILGTAALFIFARKVDKSSLRSALAPGLLLGFIVFIGFAAQTWGLVFTTASRSGFITGTLVVMVPFLAVLILRSPLKFRHLLAALLALAGIFLLTRPDITDLNPGDLLTLFCALSFAIHVVVLQRVSRKGFSLPLAFYQVALVAAVSVPFAGALEGFYGALSLKVWGLAALVAATSTAFAFWLQAHFQPLTRPQSAAVIYTMEPVFAALFAYLFIGESLPNPAGAALILAGMVVAEWRR